MKIAVIAANGKSGKLIADESVSRGHEVTAIVRGENRSNAQHEIVREVLDITPEDLAGFDAVVDAFGTFHHDQLPLHTAFAMHLGDALAGTEAPLYIVGGAGSLVADDKGTPLYATENFPAEYLPNAKAQAEELEALRQRDDFRWVFVSPAADYQPDGPRTGNYELAGDQFTVNAHGVSEISYADFAVAMVDLIENGGHIHERVSVRY